MNQEKTPIPIVYDRSFFVAFCALEMQDGRGCVCGEHHGTWWLDEGGEGGPE